MSKWDVNARWPRSRAVLELKEPDPEPPLVMISELCKNDYCGRCEDLDCGHWCHHVILGLDTH